MPLALPVHRHRPHRSLQLHQPRLRPEGLLHLPRPAQRDGHLARERRLAVVRGEHRRVELCVLGELAAGERLRADHHVGSRAPGGVHPEVVAVAVLGLAAEDVVLLGRAAHADLRAVLAEEGAVGQPRLRCRPRALGLFGPGRRAGRRVVGHLVALGQRVRPLEVRVLLVVDELELLHEGLEVLDHRALRLELSAELLAVREALELLEGRVLHGQQRGLLLVAGGNARRGLVQLLVCA
mmetsp:Transcript_17537/g.58758  ORF Transcript_17537/g.58758 Transcript_17537/m.58758 type:complete len:238 (-) Transcript_17537:272-985(-)